MIFTLTGSIFGRFCLNASTNLDVDRHYLVRDSYYAGVQYGKIDVDWLISHMARHINDQGQMALALDAVRFLPLITFWWHGTTCF